MLIARLDESDIMPLKIEFRQRLNAGKFTLDSSMALWEFVEKVYLPYSEELRASTKKEEIRSNHISNHVGHIRLREFRTVDASKMLRAIAEEHDLNKTTVNILRVC